MDSWPMLERLAVAALTAHLKRGRPGVNLPDDVQNGDGFARVTRGPGSDDGITDAPLLDLEAFHSDRGVAWDIAEDARQILLSLTGTVLAGHLIDRVETATSPNWVYYGPHVERYASSYRIEYRR